MKKNLFNYGFTLVELLAVIVILAIILAVAVPGISNILESSSKNAFKSDAKMIIKAIEYKKLEDESFDETQINESNIKSLLNINDSNYQSVRVTVENGKPHVVVVGKGKWEGITIVGTYDAIQAVDDYEEEEPPIPDPIIVNAPALATGMTPVKWNGTSWINTTADDTEWYNYENKEWANAKTADGSFWVWIPRYIYKISSGWHSRTAGIIDVKFSTGTDDTLSGTVTLDTGSTANASNNKWTNHPAFTFGSTELTGIWIAKFEASVSNTSDPCYTNPSAANCDKTTLLPKIVPNAKIWNVIRVGYMFTVSRNMETSSIYGWGTSGSGIDTHLIKNVEWGAAAYLSKSSFGKTDEIWINSSSQFITGCAGNSVSAEYSETCNTYDSIQGVNASTTGNIYGIYDMSGGGWEFTASYVNNGHSNLTTNGNSIVTADSKYKDVYPVTTDTAENNYNNAINKKGGIIYETSSSHSEFNSWYGDYSSMPNTMYPWFMVGGSNGYGVAAGAFNFVDAQGAANWWCSFRPVLVVAPGI